MTHSPVLKHVQLARGGRLRLWLSLVVLCAVLIAGGGAETPPSTSAYSPANPGVRTRARERLARIGTAAYYLSLTDGASIGRKTGDLIQTLKETGAQIVLLGFMQGPPLLETPDDIPVALPAKLGVGPEQLSQWITARGYSYRALRETVSAIKAEMPDLLITGGIPAQWLNAVERHPVSGAILNPPETWAMALDPEKWRLTRNGQPVTKEQFQREYAVSMGWAKRDTEYDREKVSAFYPDLTNSAFQELLVSWAKKQIDCGVDVIWIDLLFRQAVMAAQLANDPNHAAVKDAYDAACGVVDEIHRYGDSLGKYIHVGTWALPMVKFPFPMPDVDYVTMTPLQDEVLAKKIDAGRWAKELRAVHARFDSIPAFVFIDCAGDRGVMAEFSQSLSPDEQSEMIKQLHAFCRAAGLIFAYPLHGGGMGGHARRRAFGQSDSYDSLAPEFRTFDTIRSLSAQRGK